MSINNDNSPFENFDDQGYEPQMPPPLPSGGGGNRTFMVAVGIMAGIFVLTLIGVVLYILTVQVPRNQANQSAAAQIYAQNTMIAAQATSDAATAVFLLTPSATLPTTPAPTNTPVVVQNTPTLSNTATITPPAPGSAEELAGRTATVAAFLTQVAAGGFTGGGTVTVTPTALPATGFADEVGLPAMLAAAALLVVIIVVVRRLRLNTQA
jgi:hypothetical protein